MRAAKFLVAAATVAVATAGAHGAQVKINTTPTSVGSDFVGGNQGGGFRATEQGGFIGVMGGRGGDASSFITFCLERNENLANNVVYDTKISIYAVGGGGGAIPDPDPSNPTGFKDPITTVTAALYREFRRGGNFGGTGVLAALSGGAWSTEASTALQLAIWKEEGEFNASLTNQFNNNTMAQLMHAWGVDNDTGSLGNVRVLQLWASGSLPNPGTGDVRQDVLTIIPLPSAAGLACLGLIAVGGRNRRRAF
jgi:hypothetical protein